ncbi:hypothetical protein M758_5G102200 [Ceratodon purpureus]|nr:hypothetical protein M758_5G102200 [Ceratodon purpureus]
MLLLYFFLLLLFLAVGSSGTVASQACHCSSVALGVNVLLSLELGGFEGCAFGDRTGSAELDW